jgi:DNA repair exonuclease SbcCD nuclease subunit
MKLLHFADLHLGMKTLGTSTRVRECQRVQAISWVIDAIVVSDHGTGRCGAVCR